MRSIRHRYPDGFHAWAMANSPGLYFVAVNGDTLLGRYWANGIVCPRKIQAPETGPCRSGIGRPANGEKKMTYCVGILLEEGMVLASDSRTNAGLDNIATFCKMTAFEREGDRVIVLLSSGNLAGTQAVISVLRQRGTAGDGSTHIWNANTLFDVAILVADAMRDIDRRDGSYLTDSGGFNASFILGGQIRGEPMRLFRLYSEGNFIEAGLDTTAYFQTGEAKYGKPIIDRVITPATTLADAAKCALVSFDSTMRSNLSVGMPIDLLCYRRDSLRIEMRRRFDEGNDYFTALSRQWSAGVRDVFSRLPELVWGA